jgi:hypothetical protein
MRFVSSAMVSAGNICANLRHLRTKNSNRKSLPDGPRCHEQGKGDITDIVSRHSRRDRTTHATYGSIGGSGAGVPLEHKPTEEPKTKASPSVPSVLFCSKFFRARLRLFVSWPIRNPNSAIRNPQGTTAAVLPPRYCSADGLPPIRVKMRRSPEDAQNPLPRLLRIFVVAAVFPLPRQPSSQ